MGSPSPKIKSPYKALAPTASSASARPKRSTALGMSTLFPFQPIWGSSSRMALRSRVCLSPEPSSMGVFWAARARRAASRKV